MKQIDTKQWKEFVIKDLFTVKRPSARSQANYEDGDVPFVASGNFNNGILKYLQPKEDEILDSGNCITVSPIDGSSFYQEDDFLGRGGAGSSIILLYNTNLNLYNGYFIATVIRTVCRKYAYSDMANKDTIGTEKIKLPVDETGNPDFSYMESYMKNQELAVSSSLTDLQSAKKSNVSRKIDISKWKEFVLSEIFDMQKQTEISPIQAYYDDGDGIKYPFYGQSKMNNGIISYISLDDKYLNNKNALCSILIHSNTHECVLATTPFYLKDGHGATSIFSNAKLTELSALFVMSVLKIVMSEKFNYDKKATKEALKELKLPLPANTAGEPDYEYMVEYYRKIQKQSMNILANLQAV